MSSVESTESVFDSFSDEESAVDASVSSPVSETAGSVTPDPAQRAEISLTQGKAALAAMGIALAAIIATFLLALAKNFAAIPVGLGAIGFSCGAYGRHLRHMEFKALWKRFPHEEAEKFPAAFNDDMRNIVGSGTGWLTAMLVALFGAIGVIVFWALGDQQPFVAVLALAFGAMMGWVAKSTLEGEEALLADEDSYAPVAPGQEADSTTANNSTTPDTAPVPETANQADLEWDAKWAPITE